MVINIIIAVALIVIAACQVKQAFYPIIFPSYEDNVVGVEVPKDMEYDTSSPVFKMVMDAYEKQNTMKTPTAFVQNIIDDFDAGVEIITDKEENEF